MKHEALLILATIAAAAVAVPAVASAEASLSTEVGWPGIGARAGVTLGHRVSLEAGLSGYYNRAVLEGWQDARAMSLALPLGVCVDILDRAATPAVPIVCAGGLYQYTFSGEGDSLQESHGGGGYLTAGLIVPLNEHLGLGATFTARAVWSVPRLDRAFVDGANLHADLGGALLLRVWI